MSFDQSRKQHRALSAVLRVAGHRLDSEAAQLVSIRAKITALETERSALTACRARPDTAFFFEAGRFAIEYIRGLRDEEAKLTADIDDLTRDASLHEARVRALYKEKASVEMVCNRFAGRISKHVDRREALEHEERSLDGWLRIHISQETEGEL